MDLGRALDRAIGVISPRAGYQRAAYRQAFDQLEAKKRRYAAADRNRLNGGWTSSRSSSDSELLPSLPEMRARSRQFVRDGLGKSAKRGLVAYMVGDGIEGMAVHSDRKLQKLAQGIYLDWAHSAVDGDLSDFYQVQKTAAGLMVQDGDSGLLWTAENGVPDARVQVRAGTYIDHTETRRLPNGGRIIGGVEYGKNGKRAAYWLWDEDPGDYLSGAGAPQRSRVPVEYFDHVFEIEWDSQSRGQPWFHAGLELAEEIQDTKQAVRVRRRVEACLAVFRTPGDIGDEPKDLGQREKQGDGRTTEELAPGMIVEGRRGEKFEFLNPTSVGDADSFLLTETIQLCALLGVPHDIATGDVRQANYSSLRASRVHFYTLLDDWQMNTLVPRICNPCTRRLMRRKALELNEPRLNEVRFNWTPPPRPWVDPLKDGMAEQMDVRSGFDNRPRALARRGIDYQDFYGECRDDNALIDAYGLAFDTDPRRLTGAGMLQAPQGYVLPKNLTAGEQSAARWLIRMGEAEEANDEEMARACLLKAVSELERDGRSEVAGEILRITKD